MEQERFDHEYRSCSRTYATICIYHAKMHPDEISNILDIEPDYTCLKGDKPAIKNNGWFLTTKDAIGSKDLGFHLEAILDYLKNKENFIKELKSRGAEVKILCFWASSSGNGGPRFDQHLIQRLSSIPADLELDIYFD